MKKLLTVLLAAGYFCCTYAQQSKVLVEIGGAYRNTSTSNIVNENTTNSSTFKTPKLHTQVGIGVSSHAFLGFSYRFSKAAQTQLQETVYDQYNTIERNKNKFSEKINGFGAFYRYYVRPFGESRWNAFAELNPSYQKIQFSSDIRREYQSNDGGSNSLSNTVTTWKTDQKALDVDVKIGASYRIAKRVHAQFTLHSLANLHNKFANKDYAGDEHKTSFQLFVSPLSNSFISFLYSL
ncbi:hypothetical protein [Sphingobacterium suaedae]|uniref:Outer membrane protein beta-barrel domain-containing protein n=1 Tax=Sphingobacterium suaedae TaxID=1686402 RepID=A0ABW5KMW4_9SPHI